MARIRSQKKWIPVATRQAVALRHGIEPGHSGTANCFYCGVAGTVTWARRRDGKPSTWVHFSLELDHYFPESRGGGSEPENIVLACRTCNRRKGSGVA